MAGKKAPVLTNEELKIEISELRGDVKSAEAAHDALNDRFNDTLAQVRLLEKSLEQAHAETAFERDRADALEKRLQRMSGYLDRVMDEENMDQPVNEILQARPAPKGPIISNVVMPTKQSRGDSHFSLSAHNEHRSQNYPDRTF